MSRPRTNERIAGGSAPAITHPETPPLSPEPAAPPSSLAPSAPAVPRHGRLIPAAGTPLENCPTNLNLSNPAHKAMAFNALSSADETVQAGGAVTFCACWWLVHPVETPDPVTGEIHQHTRTVFIAADGSTVASCSDVVPHRLAAACTLFSPQEWEAGIAFRIVSRPRKRGPGNYHDLKCVTVPRGQPDTQAK